MATAEERLAKIKEKQAQLKAQEKKIITQEKAKERKLRTKRLIEIGGTAESILGRPFQDDDLQKFANFLKQQEARCCLKSSYSLHIGTSFILLI